MFCLSSNSGNPATVASGEKGLWVASSNSVEVRFNGRKIPIGMITKYVYGNGYLVAGVGHVIGEVGS